MIILSRVTSVVFILLCLGCSGRLKYTINDALIADVQVADKQAMLSVRDEQAKIQEETLKAKSEQAVAERDLAAAEAEAGIAKLQSKKVEADLVLAKSTTDINRIDRAKARLSVAELGRSTADAKVQWRRLRLKFAEQAVRVLDRVAQHAEARYEQEKARLTAAKGRTPYKSFSLSQFDLQVAVAQTRVDMERVESDKLKQEVLQIESRYQDLQRQLAVARSEAPSQAIPPAPPLGTSPPS